MFEPLNEVFTVTKKSVLNAVEKLNTVLNKVDDFKELDLEISERVKDNRIITLEGYLKFLDEVGIPRLKKIASILKEDEHV